MPNRAAIELDDVGLLIQADDDSPPTIDPAVALVRKDGIMVGLDAALRCRLEPRRLHDRFWQDLSNESLARPYPTSLSTADLAHAHLVEAWRRSGVTASEVVMCVPGDLGPAALGLAIGVARAAEVPVVGLVDIAVASSADRGLEGAAVHLEIYRHRAVATSLEQRGQKLTRGTVAVDASIGLAGLYSQWARWVAGEFVRTTRFDPLDQADSEQDLWNRLDGWLSEVRRGGAARLSFTAGDRVHAIEVTEQSLADTVRESYETIRELALRLVNDTATTTLVLGPRAAALPGLARVVEQSAKGGSMVLSLAAAANGALRHAGSIVSADEDLPIVTELETGASWQLPVAGRPDRQESSSRGAHPTHVLHCGFAHPIGLPGLVIGTAPSAERPTLALTGDTAGISRSHCSLRRAGAIVIVEDHSRYGTLLNDRPLEAETEVVAGDRLHLGSPGIELQLVTVVTERGSS